jgi:hypothetical protein
MKNGQGVTSNIFKRMFNYINTKRYERREWQQEYKKDWGKVKWQYRAFNFAVILGVYYTGQYFSKYEYNHEKIKENYLSLWEELSNEVTKGLNTQPIDFKRFINELQEQLVNYYKLEIYEDRKTIAGNKEGQAINTILNQLTKEKDINLKLLRVNKLLSPEEHGSETKELRNKLE